MTNSFTSSNPLARARHHVAHPAEAVDRFLWRRGFAGPVRRVARVLILLSAGLILLGCALWPFIAWPFWVGAGAALSTWNFYSLAFFVQRLFPAVTAEAASPLDKVARQVTENMPENFFGEGSEKSAKIVQGEATRGFSGFSSRNFLFGQILRSNLRLFITGILIYTALVICRAHPFALVAGLSSTIFIIPVLLLVRPDRAHKLI